LALNVTTGNDNAGWFHRLEGTHEFANDVYTLSFWAKSATPRAMTVGANSYDSSTDTFDETHTTSPSTFTPTSSWQKFTFKVTFSNMNTLGSFASGDYTAFFITQGSSTSTAAWKLDLALVQFEKGEQSTPFEHRSYGDELRRCQRYYFRTTGSSTGYGNLATVSRVGNTLYRGIIEFPVTMRSRPSFSSSGSFQTLDSGFTFSSINGGDGASFDSHGIQVTMTSNGTAGQSTLFRQANDIDAALIYDAEL
jgi:hypothetical protein